MGVPASGNAVGAGPAGPDSTVPDAPAGPAPLAEDAIAGTLTIAADLASEIAPGAMVFVIARKPSGPPVAAARFAPTFPLEFRIGKDNMMFQGQDFAGSYDIEARIAQSGTAGPAQSGDIEGTPEGNPIAVGSSGVPIALDRVVP